MRASSRLSTLISRAVGLARQTSILQVATMYTVVQNGPVQKNVRVIDYRSDTLSMPTKAMRQAMFNAEVGDDGYLEDPTVLALELKMALMLEKEAALFVPSGTMANLLAVLTHCDRRGCEIIAGSESHILLWEQAGAAMIGGVQVRTVTNRADGTFDLDEMARLVRTQYRLCFEPMTRLICVENTHNKLGGRVLPLAWLHKLGARARAMGVALHMDGARLFNAAISLGVPVTTIVRDFDSVSICLSKGLGAPVGSLLIGSAAFILRARELRKALGGGMRQAGIIAAAGLYCLDNMVDRLTDDHLHARAIAQGIADAGSTSVTVELDSLETNILLLHFDLAVVTARQFCERMETVTDEDESMGTATIVRLLAMNDECARLVVCCNNSPADVDLVVHKMQSVIRQFDSTTCVTKC